MFGPVHLPGVNGVNLIKISKYISNIIAGVIIVLDLILNALFVGGSVKELDNVRLEPLLS